MAHNWNKVLDDILKGLRFSPCLDDLGLYYRIQDGSVIVVHVDNLLCGFANKDAKEQEENAMSQYLTLEKRGLLKRFLCMDWTWVPEGVRVSGSTAIEALARDYGITKVASSPFTTKVEPKASTDIKKFQALTGRLLFITRMWRPDI